MLQVRPARVLSGPEQEELVVEAHRLLDLLTEEESAVRQTVFDIELLAERLAVMHVRALS